MLVPDEVVAYNVQAILSLTHWVEIGRERHFTSRQIQREIEFDYGKVSHWPQPRYLWAGNRSRLYAAERTRWQHQFQLQRTAPSSPAVLVTAS